MQVVHSMLQMPAGEYADFWQQKDDVLQYHFVDEFISITLSASSHRWLVF